MTKLFKHFNTGFTFQEQRDCRTKWLYNGSTESDRNYTCWPEKVAQWPQEFVQFCVYQAPDHREWQLFRVSMKGLPTKSKLYMLHNRFVTLLGMANNLDDIQKCRIDNYIGALVRGGQLDSELRVQR